MKRIVYYIFAISEILFLIGCSDKTNFVEESWSPSLIAKYIRLKDTNVNFAAETDLGKTITVEAQNALWRIGGSCPWISLPQTEGNGDAVITIVANPNTDPTTSRTAVFQFESGDSSYPYAKSLTISQAAAEYRLNISETTVNVPASLSLYNVDVDSNADWTYSTNDDWIHCTKEGSKLSFNIDENTTVLEADRVGYIKVSNSKLTKAITINQQPPSITSKNEEIIYGIEGGEHQQTVTSDVAWKATTSAYFITVTPENNTAGQSKLTISTSANRSEYDRTGNVYLNIGNKAKVRIPVRQSGIICNVSVNSIGFSSIPETKSFDIISNCEWTIVSYPSWLKIDKESGKGNANVKLNVDENNTTKELEGDIVVCDANKVVTRKIHITQSGKHAYVDVNTLEFSHKAEQKGLSFNTDGTWSASVDADWVLLDSNTGTGSHTINVAVKENMTSSDRQATITLVIAGATHLIKVSQDSKYLVLPSSAFNFDASAGYSTVYISSNTHWTATAKDKPNWLVVTPTSGDNDANITIGVSENKTAEERHGQIIVSIPDVKDYIINVTQTGKTIKVDKASVEFPSSGGTVVVNVTSDGEYTVSKSGNWFGYTKNGDAISVIAPQNSTGVRREGKLVFTLSGNASGNYYIEVPIIQL